MAQHPNHSDHHNDHDGHDEQERRLPESSGINPRPIVLFLTILTLATGLVYGIVLVLLWGFDQYKTATAPPPESKVMQRTLPAEPRLQGAPEPDPNNPGQSRASLLPLDDMRAYRKQLEAEAGAYGWVKGREGVEARIPIERAKTIMLERKLPVKADAQVAEFATAEKVRKQLSSADASGGRLIGK